MNRRSMLAAIGTALVAGCSSDASESEPEPESNDTDEPDAREPGSESESEIDQRLAFGEWAEFDKFGVTVDGFELVDSVTLSGYGREITHEFDGQLAVVDYQLKAIASEPAEYLARSLTLEAVVDGERTEVGVGETFREYNPTVSDVKMRESREYGHYGHTFEPTEVAELWTGVVVSDEVAADDLAIVVDGTRWPRSS